MAETLGSLCDKLTVVKLKQWHTRDKARRESLAAQEVQLMGEVDAYLGAAVAGTIPPDRLVFAANKVYAPPATPAEEIRGTLGEMVARLANVNCALWHEQEKVYQFEAVPVEEKDAVVRELARLNLERNACIEEIDRRLHDLVAGSR
jgi:hypothetical protein